MGRYLYSVCQVRREKDSKVQIAESRARYDFLWAIGTPCILHELEFLAPGSPVHGHVGGSPIRSRPRTPAGRTSNPTLRIWRSIFAVSPPEMKTSGIRRCAPNGTFGFTPSSFATTSLVT